MADNPVFSSVHVEILDAVFKVWVVSDPGAYLKALESGELEHDR